MYIYIYRLYIHIHVYILLLLFSRPTGSSFSMLSTAEQIINWSLLDNVRNS